MSWNVYNSDTILAQYLGWSMIRFNSPPTADEFDLTECLVSSDGVNEISTENILYILGKNITHNGANFGFAKIGDEDINMNLAGTTNGAFELTTSDPTSYLIDEDEGKITVLSSGDYKIRLSLGYQRVSGSADRIHNLFVLINGVSGSCSSSTEVNSADWMQNDIYTVISLNSGDTIQMGYSQVNPVGVTVDNIRAAGYQMLIDHVPTLPR